jgi:hypothetical protein
MGIIFANEKTIEKMRSLEAFMSHVLFQVPINTSVDPRVSDHTDLSLFVSGAVYVAPNIYGSFVERLEEIQHTCTLHEGASKFLLDKLICGTKSLRKEYPHNIAYNAVKLKKHFFHKLEYTESKILESIICDRIEINQGYTRCSTMVLTEGAVITEDAGLAQTYRNYGYDVLVIEKGHVVLPGFNYGFFGGTGGVIEDALVLNGALEYHPDEVAIRAFVHGLGLRIVELHNGPLIDCGSILYFSTK